MARECRLESVRTQVTRYPIRHMNDLKALLRVFGTALAGKDQFDKGISNGKQT